MTVEWLGQPVCPPGFQWNPDKPGCHSICPAGWTYNEATQTCVAPTPGQQTFVPSGQQQQVPVTAPQLPVEPEAPPPSQRPDFERPLRPGPTAPARKKSAAPVLIALGLAAAVAAVVVSR